MEAATCASEGRGASVVQLRGGRSCRSRNENGSRTALKPAVIGHRHRDGRMLLSLLTAELGTLGTQLDYRIATRLNLEK